MFINALDTMIMKTAIIGSTTIVVTLHHDPLRETVTTTRGGEMRDANQGREKEITIIIEDTTMIAVIGGGVTQEIRERGEKRREGSKREGDSSRQTGTRAVCMHGRRMIMMLIKENCNYSLKNSQEETDSCQLTTLRQTLLLLPKKSQ